jgi:hypothetical protein
MNDLESSPQTTCSEAEPTVVPSTHDIPSTHDMIEVHNLSGVVARLEQELDLARLQLRDAWARVPFDSTILKKPYKSDIAVTCRACGKPTVWRTARGLAEHQPSGTFCLDSQVTTMMRI